MSAGPSADRITVASTNTATARPSPIICTMTSLAKANAQNTATMIRAALVITEPVLDEILEYSDRGRRCEVGGFLLGGVSGDKTPFVVIKHFHPAVQAVSGAASPT